MPIVEYEDHSLFEDSLDVGLIVDFALVLQVRSLAELFHQLLHFVAARQDVQVVGCEVAGAILVQDLEDVHDVVLQALSVDLL